MGNQKKKWRSLTLMMLLISSVMYLTSCGFVLDRLLQEDEHVPGENKVQTRNDRIKEEVKTYLEEKYNEPFDIVALDGRSDITRKNTVLLECHNKMEEPLKFTTRYNLETGEMYDKYLNEVVGRNEEPKIREYIHTLWENA